MTAANEILGLDRAAILQIARQLRAGYRMKQTLRYASVRPPEHSESNAEHVYGLMLLMQYFLPHEDPEGQWDRNRIAGMLLYHDIPEIIHGDIAYHLKTREQVEREHAAAPVAFGQLPAPLAEEGFALWREYERQDTPEARFAYALDKLEPMFELFENPYGAATMHRLKFTFEMHLAKKLRATEGFPVMRRFVEVMSDEMRRAGVFYEDEAEEKE